MKLKRAKLQNRPILNRDRISHLHIAVDEELLQKIEAHARKLDNHQRVSRPNLSAAVRDLLRSSLGLTDKAA